MRNNLPALPVRVIRSGRRHETLEAIDEEMARPACRIEQPHFLGAEGLNRRRERPVENERAHEVGRLAERKALLHDRIELLVQVAHQLALEALICEAPCGAGVGIAMPPERNERAGEFVGWKSDFRRLW